MVGFGHLKPFGGVWTQFGGTPSFKNRVSLLDIILESWLEDEAITATVEAVTVDVEGVEVVAEAVEVATAVDSADAVKAADMVFIVEIWIITSTKEIKIR